MKSRVHRIAGLALGVLGLVFVCGCESTGGGGGGVSGSMYYGVGFYDPWYYGGYHDDVDIIVNPPTRPQDPPSGGEKPKPPVAKPLPAPAPASRPSIPSTPRPSMSPGARPSPRR